MNSPQETPPPASFKELLAAATRTERDDKIMAFFDMFEEGEPDISTERLVAQTASAARCDEGRVYSALARRSIAQTNSKRPMTAQPSSIKPIGATQKHET